MPLRGPAKRPGGTKLTNVVNSGLRGVTEIDSNHELGSMEIWKFGLSDLVFK